jgi:hypothetical protein
MSFIPRLALSYQVLEVTTPGAGGSTDQALVTPVDPNRALVLPLGCRSTDASGFDEAPSNGAGFLLNGTTFRANNQQGFGGYQAIIRVAIIELPQQFLNSNMQHGFIDSGGATSATLLISQVGPNAIPIALGINYNYTFATASAIGTRATLDFSDTTHLRISASGSLGSNLRMGFCIFDPK